MFEFLMFPYKLIFDISTLCDSKYDGMLSIKYNCISLNEENDLGENYMLFCNSYGLPAYPIHDEEEHMNTIIWTHYSYITYGYKCNEFIPTLGNSDCLKFANDIDVRLMYNIKSNKLIFDRETKFEKLIR